MLQHESHTYRLLSNNAEHGACQGAHHTRQNNAVVMPIRSDRDRTTSLDKNIQACKQTSVYRAKSRLACQYTTGLTHYCKVNLTDYYKVNNTPQGQQYTTESTVHYTQNPTKSDSRLQAQHSTLLSRKHSAGCTVYHRVKRDTTNKAGSRLQAQHSTLQSKRYTTRSTVHYRVNSTSLVVNCRA